MQETKAAVGRSRCRLLRRAGVGTVEGPGCRNMQELVSHAKEFGLSPKSNGENTGGFSAGERQDQICILWEAGIRAEQGWRLGDCGSD